MHIYITLQHIQRNEDNRSTKISDSILYNNLKEKFCLNNYVITALTKDGL